MQELIDRIRAEAVHVGDGIVKVDSFINHQVDGGLMRRIGQTFAERFHNAKPISKVITAEVSGIAPALATAEALGVPLVYARKRSSKQMTDDYHRAEVTSRTQGNQIGLWLSKLYLRDTDQVLIIDDFLATGSTLEGLVDIVLQSGAKLAGIGCVIEKPAEQGRERLARADCQLEMLAQVTVDGDQVHVNG